MLANSNSSVKLLALGGHFPADSVIIENIVLGTFSTLAIDPCLTTIIIIQGSEEGKVTIFDRSAQLLEKILGSEEAANEEEKDD